MTPTPSAAAYALLTSSPNVPIARRPTCCVHVHSRARNGLAMIGRANAIAGMSARIAAGGGELASLVRERQDLSEQVLALDQTLIASASHAARERNLAAEQALQTQVSQIADRMRERDRLIATQFPD